MAHRTLAASIMLGTLVLSGCASTDEPPTVVTKRTLIFEEDNRRYIHSVATTEYGNEGLGGAAVLKPDVIHVMGDKRRTDVAVANDQVISDSFSKSRSEALSSAIADVEQAKAAGGAGAIAEKLASAMNVLSEIQSRDKSEAVSHYDMAIWDKFCAGGEDMTNDDWTQMQSFSVDQVPGSVADDCNYPDLSLTTEIQQSYCADEDLSARETFILHHHNAEETLSCPGE